MSETIEPVSGTNLHKPLSPKIWLPVLIILTAAVGYAAWSESLRDQNSPNPLFSSRGGSAFGGNQRGGRGGVPEDWQIYRNPEYGFEVKYPGEFPIRTQTDAAVLFHLEINPAPPLEADMGGPPRYLWIQVDNKEPPVDCLRVWSQEGTSGGIVTISGVSATRCLIPGSFFGEGVGLLIQINHGKYSYYFISDFYDRNKETIDQILSTFRFTK